MALREITWSPGQSLENVTEDVVNGGGVINSSNIIGLYVDLGTNKISSAGTTRAIAKSEIIQALDTFKEFIIRDSSGQFDNGTDL